MCLTSFRKEPFISDKDIICYKVLEIVGNGEFVTPVQRIPVKLGEEIVAGDIEGKMPVPVYHKIGEGDVYATKKDYQIGEGFIHAYLKLPTMEYYLSNKEGTNYNKVIVKCIIPAGTEFYLGNEENFSYRTTSLCWGYLDNTICAKRMILSNKILTLDEMDEINCKYRIEEVSNICGIDIDYGDYAIKIEKDKLVDYSVKF